MLQLPTLRDKYMDPINHDEGTGTILGEALGYVWDRDEVMRLKKVTTRPFFICFHLATMTQMQTKLPKHIAIEFMVIGHVLSIVVTHVG